MSIREQGSVEPAEAAPRPIDPGVRIGHVHLRTADIDRVKGFYCGVLGFDVVAEARDVPGWGTTGASDRAPEQPLPPAAGAPPRRRGAKDGHGVRPVPGFPVRDTRRRPLSWVPCG